MEDPYLPPIIPNGPSGVVRGSFMEALVREHSLMEDLERALAPLLTPYEEALTIATEMADNIKSWNEELEKALGPQQQQFIHLVAKDLHRDQPWFHGRISRSEADIVINNDGHKDGKFLVRERDDKTYALSLSYHKKTQHYKIDKHKGSAAGEKLAINDGARFDSLMEMISHYHNQLDGLLCKLACPCVRPGYKPKGPISRQNSGIYGSGYLGCAVDLVKKLNDPMIQTQGIINNEHVQNSIWDDPDLEGEFLESPPVLPPRNKDGDQQKIYDSVPRTEDVFNINQSDLELSERLGAGNFGAVVHGKYQRNGETIPVAIKTLKHDDIWSTETDLLREARVMAGVQHRHIVRLFGICHSEHVMLVMELAPFGALNKYLKRHQDIPVKTVLELMFQVAEGMQYLESKNFIHRDLAARNVLLVNEHFAKISDFGMSKALGRGSNYYQAKAAGKWPLKWYAPECIYFFLFNSKSDVWSFGVTLWEALSYGAKPYKGRKGQEIVKLIEGGTRLQKPEKCPQEVYQIMLRCWNYDKSNRPSFKELVELLRKYK